MIELDFGLNGLFLSQYFFHSKIIGCLLFFCWLGSPNLLTRKLWKLNNDLVTITVLSPSLSTKTFSTVFDSVIGAIFKQCWNAIDMTLYCCFHQCWKSKCIYSIHFDISCIGSLNVYKIKRVVPHNLMVLWIRSKLDSQNRGLKFSSKINKHSCWPDCAAWIKLVFPSLSARFGSIVSLFEIRIYIDSTL